MRLERIAFAIGLIAVACLVMPSARAQMTTGKQITVKVKTPKPPNPHFDMFKGQVLHMDAQSIIVRDPKNSAVVKTFSYTPELAKRLQKLIARGGYQYGDTVQVKFKSGETVAHGISGHASKPH
ncbi:MAG TPA: hypothetical protein VJN21_15470 [Candidatus Acidoferrales bacterium]|nr:hypothetical protein [Candidatus Acidoferrales bacterium]